MLLSRREKYLRRCQEIVDDLHSRVAEKGHVPECECINLYGKSDYEAFKHELHLMDADIGSDVMTPALEWFYYSRYFLNKIYDEKRSAWMFWISIISACVAVGSLVLTICLNIR